MAMERKYLIVNIGSTSKRYVVYSENKKLYEGKFDLKNKTQLISKILKNKKIITNNNEIGLIGVRIVCPGIYFQKTREITKEYLKKLNSSLGMAPLHIKPTLKEIKSLKKEFKKTKIIGVSDSEFHSTLPEVARVYSINKKDSEKFQIYRYGYHGISIKSVLFQIKKEYKNLPEKIIICHLGGGSSITAIKNGRSVETSMGFTPLEGLPMATRSGNIDFSAALYLAKSKKFSIERIEEYLNEKSGFLGLSEYSSKLEKIIKTNKKRSKLAIEKYVYEIRKYIGAYIVILGGLDLLVFTGAIGESTQTIRNKIVKGIGKIRLTYLKVKVVKTKESEEILRKINSFL